MSQNYKFFNHKECEYFPCHKTNDPDNFNCLFCYCPLYALKDKCGGNFNDDCRDCADFDKRERLKEELKQAKQTFMCENEIISATMARQLTNQAIKEDTECLKLIMNKIRDFAAKKQYYCYISGTTPDYIIKKLNDLGYKTKLQKGDPRDPREQDNYCISW